MKEQHILVEDSIHKALKHRATDNSRTLKEEVAIILRKELGIKEIDINVK
jgi:hypothetical protein